MHYSEGQILEGDCRQSAVLPQNTELSAHATCNVLSKDLSMLVLSTNICDKSLKVQNNVFKYKNQETQSNSVITKNCYNE